MDHRAPGAGVAAGGNQAVAALFEEAAQRLEIQQANRFRIRAYRQAARLLEGLREPVAALLARGEPLDALPGIGPDLADKIAEAVATGSFALLDRLRAQTPAGLQALQALQGLGPQRVRRLQQELGIGSVDELIAAARAGRLAHVPGFGARLQQRLLDAGTGAAQGGGARRPIAAVRPQAERLLALLRALPQVQRAELAGSVRRGSASAGDLDLLVQTDDGAGVIRAFAAAPGVQAVFGAGHTLARVLLDDGLQVDLRAVPAEAFGAAWIHFTGPKAHNLWLRRRAQRRGCRLNEYGLHRGAERLAGADETSVYAALGLPWIEPAARAGAARRAVLSAPAAPGPASRGAPAAQPSR